MSPILLKGQEIHKPGSDVEEARSMRFVVLSVFGSSPIPQNFLIVVLGLWTDRAEKKARRCIQKQ